MDVLDIFALIVYQTTIVLLSRPQALVLVPSRLVDTTE